MLEILSNNMGKLILSIMIHFVYVLISVFIGSTVGILSGIALSRAPKASKYILSLIGVFQTIPGIVFIGVLFIYIGMKPVTVIIALSIYAIFPILKNTYVGIINVEKSYIEAAMACGMSDFKILINIEIPLAISSIISGIRMSTIYTVSWAVLAAMIGQGGLGEFIYVGIDTNMKAYIVIGAIPAAFMAIALGYIIDKIQYHITPRGIRRKN